MPREDWVANTVERIFEADMAHCTELDRHRWARRGWLHRLKDNAFYVFNELL